MKISRASSWWLVAVGVLWLTSAAPLRAQGNLQEALKQLEEERKNKANAPANPKQNPFQAARDARNGRNAAAGQAAVGAEQENPGAPALTFGSAPFDLVALAPLFKTPEPDAEPDDGPVLPHEALRSWNAGDQTTALRLMFGHMAAEYEHASPTIEKVMYSSLLKRPVWNVRFGVSMWVRDGRTDGEPPSPIPGTGGSNRRGVRAQPGFAGSSSGDSAADDALSAFRAAGLANNRNARSRTPNDRRSRTANARDSLARTPAADPAANGEAPNGETESLPVEPDPELNEMLGLVAEVIGEEFGTRYERGDFGQLLVDLTAPKAVEPEAPENPQVTPQDGPQDNPTADAPAVASESPDSFQQALLAFEARKGRAATAAPAGAAPAGAAPASAAPAGRPTAESDPVETQILTSANSLPIWRPGIVNLGTGSTKEMTDKASKSELDFLIHFEVVLKSRPGASVQNISRCRLINVATGKTIGLSKPMDNHDEKKLSGTASGGRAYVDEQIANLLAVFDRDIKVSPLPALTPEVARRRVGMLLGNPHHRSLRTLAEIRLYEKRNLLTPQEVEMAFDIVGGTDSLIFIYGRDEDRAAMARAWAAEAGKKDRS